MRTYIPLTIRYDQTNNWTRHLYEAITLHKVRIVKILYEVITLYEVIMSEKRRAELQSQTKLQYELLQDQ